jgi:YidC/Oxa1 family membrane protein insertase
MASRDAAVAAEVRTPLLRAEFGADGAVLRWVLRYRGDKPLVVAPTLPPLAVALGRAGQPGELVGLRPATSRLVLDGETPRGSLRLSGVSSAGQRVEKELGFTHDGWLVDVRLRVEGDSGAGGPLQVALYWAVPVLAADPGRSPPWFTFAEGPDHAQLFGRILVAPRGAAGARFEAPAAVLKDAKESPGGPELKDPMAVPPAVAGDAGWVALENDYFIAALVPGEGGRLWRARERDLTQIGVVFGEVRGGAWEGRSRLYVGPKEWDRLAAVGAGLEEAQARNYGDFLWLSWLPMWWFCVPLLWIMNFLGTRVPGQNYGVAIILLTVLVKVLFYPLTHKSMTSMKQMQALQPQLNALRSKYRSDPQRFQREQMELFRKHRVNPMGGCLPMVVQVPIFYALYLTLQYSVELQGAPFLLWITDLSKKDPYYVLPVLMGASMLVQQKMTPTVGDPRQAKIMLILPVIFTFTFLEFPTGLVLYWLVNNLLSIGQQYLIDQSALRRRESATDLRPEREPKKS